MGNYQDTTTWKKMLGNGNERMEDCQLLKVEYEKFRNNAKILAGEIAMILPDYTVHDITHIDALWEMADIFLPTDYPLSPAECFVLGGAFILHDLGMAMAAYPEGIRGIRKETIWRDTVANLCKQKNLPYDFERPDSIDREVDKIATEKTLRFLHAQKAKELAKISWKDSQGKDIYLIDNERLRNAYGTIIGQIAQSHWWYCEELPEAFPKKLGAVSCFSETWTVDPLRLACIVRIADAMNIDDRRAPALLKAIRNVNDLSKLHWVFQEKLYQPRIENNRVVYTSKSPFDLQEIDAWWLCYDILKMIDSELKNVDALLLEHNREAFGVIGVYGIDRLDQLQKTVRVEGWKPIDTCIRVNNVAKLVNTLGGMQLYGDNLHVPLRELIQNAADAIRARRYLDEESDDYGDIYLSWGEEDGQEFVQVEDNGVGMSQNVMVNVLLDFGQSFWGTDQMHKEFPGLEQKPFKATGKFGIGFYSVFMWGEKVNVISNRYDRARDNTTVLEFVNGVESRPILRKANANEIIKNGGTRIKIWLSKKSIAEISQAGFSKTMSLKERITKMCFSLDCNLYLNNGHKELLVKANDWVSMEVEDFLCRLFGQKGIEEVKGGKKKIYELWCKNIKRIKEEDGSIVGRACMYEDTYRYGIDASEGIVTIDGIRTTPLRGIIGVLKGRTDQASRDVAIPIMTQNALDGWVQEQARLLVESECLEEQQVETSAYACTLSSKSTALKLARWKDTYVNYEQIVEIAKERRDNQYYIIQDAEVTIWEREHKRKIDLKENVFVCDKGMPVILQADIHTIKQWPGDSWKIDDRLSCAVVERQIVNAFSKAWDCSMDAIIENANLSDDNTEYRKIIGICDGDNIEMRVDIINAIEKR